MSRRRWIAWLAWPTLFGVVTAFFVQLPSLAELRIAHGVLLYLLLIVGASREGEPWLAVLMVLASYVAVDWLFVPPRRQFGTPTQLDFIILMGFLVTSAVISRLVFRLQDTATVATERAEQIRVLSAERLQLEMDATRAEVLQEADRLKNALLASLTHDLRTPLATMTLLADASSGIPASEALPRMADEVQRMTEFLRAMRRFAYADPTKAMTRAIEPHVVDDLIATALRSRDALLQDRPVRVDVPAEPVLVLVQCDFTLALQILANLLENAARYTPSGSPIDITVQAEDGHAEITVADRGPGLTPDEVEQVFQPLRRGHAAEGSGAAHDVAGLGLAIARTFAQVQRGDLTYRPRAGGGAAFVLTLPRASVSSA